MDAVQTWLSQGGNPNQPVAGVYPLFLAIQHSDVVWLLLEWDADPDVRDMRGFQPLHAAASMGNLESARWLLEEGAPVDAQSRRGWTPLLEAVKQGHHEMVQFLLAWGADPDVPEDDMGMTPLCWAIQEGHVDIMETLLDHGATIDDDTIACALAQWEPDSEVMFLLRQHDDDDVEMHD